VIEESNRSGIIDVSLGDYAASEFVRNVGLGKTDPKVSQWNFRQNVRSSKGKP
jgi:hypothetical protein